MCWERSHQLQATFAAFTVNVFLWAAGVTTSARASASTEPLPCSFREGGGSEMPQKQQPKDLDGEGDCFLLSSCSSWLSSRGFGAACGSMRWTCSV